MSKTICRALAAALVVIAALLPASANELQGKPYSYLSQASNNATLVYAGPALLKFLLPVNTTTTIYYLKLYDKATAPSCGTDIPVLRIPVPVHTDGGAVPIEVGGIQFTNGVGFCLVAGIADSDNTNAATGVAINLGVAWQ